MIIMRSAIDLLDLDLVFSQQSLLTVSRFQNECGRRGLSLADGHLEAFHRPGILIPLYRLAKDVRTDGDELRAARSAGRLHDPRAEPQRPWQRYRRTFGDYNFRSSEFLYSPYQLLLVQQLRSLLPRIRVRRLTQQDFRFRLKLPESVQPFVQPHVAHNAELVVVLTALETMYRPGIIGRISLPGYANRSAWSQYKQGFDPVAILGWLGWQAEQVRDTAERLLSMAHSVDPLRDWRELVRLAHPTKWEKLRGDALVAHDHRMAAEILLRFYEDLVQVGAAAPLEEPPKLWWHALKERLHTDRGELDAVLMEFGLSPHPAVVLVLEGATEMKLMPRVMDMLDIPRRESFIKLVDSTFR